MGRPRIEDIERYLDALERNRVSARWLLEDIQNIEDSPETDAEIVKLRRKRQESEEE